MAQHNQIGNVEHNNHIPTNPHQMHMHSMSFHFGSDELILFNFWKVNSNFGKILKVKI